MNTITHAFKASGVKIPTLNKRIWLWLNDHPGKTSKEISAAIGVVNPNVSTALTAMTRRKMVTATPTKHPFRDQTLLRYTTSIREYELLPEPSVKVAKHSPFSPQLPLPLVEQPKPAVMLPPVPKSVMSVLEGYTLRELRQIRDALNKLFEFV